MELKVNLKEKSYPVIIERGAIKHINDFIDTNRKCFVISDSGVPKEHIDTITSQLNDFVLHIVPQGEGSKSFKYYEECLKDMLENQFTRSDLVIAIGGGVVGDLSGFVAASYKRGIDFVNIPTTSLSQIDSSIGGKTAINIEGYKNCVGAFHQPKAVIVDVLTLDTLDRRNYHNGLVEALKAGLIRDKELFDIFENKDIDENLEEIIKRSLMMKKEVVEIDEFETGLRKILNFGHTIGHAIESYFNLDEYLHGECVAMGMVKIIEDQELQERVIRILNKMNVPTTVVYDKEEVYRYLLNDKKASKDTISVIKVKEIGKALIEEVPFSELKEKL